MLRRSSLVALIGLASGFRTNASQDPVAARLAASSWLQLLDAAAVEASWHGASTAFKRAITIQQWAQASSSVRAPLGSVKKRTEHSATPAKSLPGAPDGNYVLLQYKTEFEKKASAVETVTVVLEADGTWKVTGYFIK